MTDEYKYCPNCFEPLEGEGVCTCCGFNIEKMRMNRNILPPFTVLNNRYLLGHILGQGGFGITYLAKDIYNNELCAVKEYMPVEFAQRASDNSDVEVLRSGGGSIYEHGRRRFLDEARTLNMLKGNPVVVQIKDYFEQNNTGYFTMEYLEGTNLKILASTMDRHRIPKTQLDVILVTVASALMEIHKKGILHRDLSPENIFLTKSGEIKLIDFGAARSYMSSQKSNGLSVLLKQGFAPPEQYERNGEQGPWTDVYALAATYYTLVSGEKLIDSLYRLRGMNQTPLIQLDCNVSPGMSDTIEKAMALKVKDRYQDFSQFLERIDVDYRSEEKKDDIELKPAVTEQYSQSRILPIPPRVEKKAKRRWFFRKKKEQSCSVPEVTVQSGRYKGEKYILPFAGIINIGRSRQLNQLVFSECDYISRIHCTLRYDAVRQTFYLMDQSVNGTFLNSGERLAANVEVPLRAGDIFYLVTRENTLKVDILRNNR